MNKRVADLWVQALRSGEFKQISGRLEADKGNCCLGVLCNLAMIEGVCDFDISTSSYFPYNADSMETCSFDGESHLLPDSVIEWSGMNSNDGNLSNKREFCLVTMNDRGLSFKEISDIIENNWRDL